MSIAPTPSSRDRARWWEPWLVALLAAAILAAVDHRVVADPGYVVTEQPVPSFIHRSVNNFERYGVGELGGVLMISFGHRERSEFQFLPHHPPLLPLLLHATQECSGTRGPVPGRWMLIAFWALTAASVFAIGRRALSRSGAWTAALLVVAAPGVLREGLVLEVSNGPVIFFSTLAVLLYARYRERPVAGRFALLAGVVTLAILSDWEGLLVTGFLALDRWCGDRRMKDPVSLLPVMGIALLVAWNGWAQAVAEGTRIVSASGHGRGDVLMTLATRINEGPVYLDQERIGALDGAWRATWHGWVHHFGIAGGALAALGLIVVLLRILRGRSSSPVRFIVLVLLVPWGYGLLFSRAALVHSFWTLGMAPGLGLLAGLAVDALDSGARRLRFAAPGLGLVAVLYGIVVGSQRWEDDLPGIEREQARVDAAVAMMAGLLGPKDGLAMVGSELRHDQLATALDRPVFGHLGAMETLRGIQERGGPPLLVAVGAAEAGRVPELSVQLSSYPYTLRESGGEPVVIFDLRTPPAFHAVLPAEQVAVFRAHAGSVEAPTLEVEEDPDSGEMTVSVTAACERVMIFASTLPDELAPLHEMPRATRVPLSRLLPGTWFLAAAGVIDDPLTGIRRFTARTAPRRIEVPLRSEYLRRALVALGTTLAGLTLGCAFIAWRLGEGPGSATARVLPGPSRRP